MKGFLATLKGKIILGVAAAVVVAVAVVAVVMVVNSPKEYRSIKVEELSGKTTIVDGNSNSQDAYEGMNLKSGDKVEVDANANMTLLLDSDKYMFADAGTKFTVEASGSSKKNNTKTKIILIEGSVLCRIDKKLSGDETYEVETPNSVMSVRGTIFRMTAYKDESGKSVTSVDVLEGAVNVDSYSDASGKSYAGGFVGAGETAQVNHGITNCYSQSQITDYNNYSKSMAQFVAGTIDSGREICVSKDVFVHSTGLATHPETENIIKEPSCSEAGKKEIYCSTCDAIIRTETIPKKEHTSGEWVVEDEAQCVERLRCSVCNEIIEERELDFELHDIERETTDTKEGCNVHRVVEDVCKVCGMKQEVSVTDLEEHTYGDWEITTLATCLTAGVRQMVCAACGNTETEEIEATGHSFGGWITVTSATCTAVGTQERACTVCGEKETSSIAATGHNYQTVKTVVASCTTTGELQKKCSSCGDIQTTVIPMTEHVLEYHHVYHIPYDGSTTFTADYKGVCIDCLETVVQETHTGTFTEIPNDLNHVNATCECGYVSQPSH